MEELRVAVSYRVHSTYRATWPSSSFIHICWKKKSPNKETVRIASKRKSLKLSIAASASLIKPQCSNISVFCTDREAANTGQVAVLAATKWNDNALVDHQMNSSLCQHAWTYGNADTSALVDIKSSQGLHKCAVQCWTAPPFCTNYLKLACWYFARIGTTSISNQSEMTWWKSIEFTPMLICMISSWFSGESIWLRVDQGDKRSFVSVPELVELPRK